MTAAVPVEMTVTVPVSAPVVVSVVMHLPVFAVELGAVTWTATAEAPAADLYRAIAEVIPFPALDLTL